MFRASPVRALACRVRVRMKACGSGTSCLVIVVMQGHSTLGGTPEMGGADLAASLSCRSHEEDDGEESSSLLRSLFAHYLFLLITAKRCEIQFVAWSIMMQGRPPGVLDVGESFPVRLEGFEDAPDEFMLHLTLFDLTAEYLKGIAIRATVSSWHQPLTSRRFAGSRSDWSDAAGMARRAA